MQKLFLGILAVTVLLLLVYTGHRSYGNWEANRQLSLARQFEAEGDTKNAQLSLLKALRSNPRNVEATRLMADLMEANESPTSLFWRRRVVEFSPASSEDRIALAKTALKAGDLATASAALEKLGAADRQTAIYQDAAGAVAAAAGEFLEAREHFAEAIRLDPQNLTLELNLAVVNLHSPDAALNVGAVDTLKRLSSCPTNGVLRCQAERELLMDALRRNQIADALSFSEKLVHENDSLFTDRLLRLETLRQNQDGGFQQELAAVRHEAGSDPDKIQHLAMWEQEKIPAENTLVWLQGLPVDVQTNPPVAILIAEQFLVLQDWPELETWLEGQDWESDDSIRHAFQSRASRGQNLPAAAKREWEQAVTSASDDKASLTTLFRLASDWKWPDESEDALRHIVRFYPGETWAQDALAKILHDKGQTKALLELYREEVKYCATNFVARNNLALTGLLLDPGEPAAHQAARELYEYSPTNISFAVTYAFSLHLKGKNAEALKIMENFNPQQFEMPSVAVYYGAILRANGDRAKAKIYFDAAHKAQLLPEEQKLISQPGSGA